MLVRVLSRIFIIGELILALLLMIPAAIAAFLYFFIMIIAWSRFLGVDVSALYPHMVETADLTVSLWFHATLVSVLMAFGAFFYFIVEIVQDHTGIRLMLFGIWRKKPRPHQVGLPIQWFGFLFLIGGAVLAIWPFYDLGNFLRVMDFWPLADLLRGKG